MLLRLGLAYQAIPTKMCLSMTYPSCWSILCPFKNMRGLHTLPPESELQGPPCGDASRTWNTTVSLLVLSFFSTEILSWLKLKKTELLLNYLKSSLQVKLFSFHLRPQSLEAEWRCLKSQLLELQCKVSDVWERCYLKVEFYALSGPRPV